MGSTPLPRPRGAVEGPGGAVQSPRLSVRQALGAVQRPTLAVRAPARAIQRPPLAVRWPTRAAVAVRMPTSGTLVSGFDDAHGYRAGRRSCHQRATPSPP